MLFALYILALVSAEALFLLLAAASALTTAPPDGISLGAALAVLASISVGLAIGRAWQRRRRRRIDADLAPAKISYELVTGLSPAAVDLCFREFERFFALIRKDQRLGLPSGHVDGAWRELAAHTELYRRYSDKVHGRLIAYDGGEVVTVGSGDEAYALTLARYRRRWREPPAQIWPPLSAVDTTPPMPPLPAKDETLAFAGQAVRPSHELAA
jgi:hypothetical protein